MEELKCEMCGYKADNEEKMKAHEKEAHGHKEDHMEGHGHHGEHH